MFFKSMNQKKVVIPIGDNNARYISSTHLRNLVSGQVQPRERDSRSFLPTNLHRSVKRRRIPSRVRSTADGMMADSHDGLFTNTNPCMLSHSPTAPQQIWGIPGQKQNSCSSAAEWERPAAICLSESSVQDPTLSQSGTAS